ncbi:acyl-CoA thioesterase [Ligilactobacillus ceti]|uniref:Acyl-coa hydrolase n=1 Tax=Ligilactobacillus ceti DSM 22408 TaxID=1122146 RepID=A0A0R2KIW1_9LACO|nr:acyl-CoA thioesterase [Ligilactobacillus ceti]KRN89342.1 acyl-coa hydrolase [Ligilactobacillus ceti DSM 22408]
MSNQSQPQIVTCRQTLSVTNHRVLASDLNHHDTVYGGRLLEMLDGTASISASRAARVDTVTASLDQLNFIAPYQLEDSFCIETYVSGIGGRSLEVFAKIIGEHLDSGERYLGLTAFLTFVIPEKGIQLPTLQPITAEEKMVCAGFSDRKAQRIANLQRQKEFQAGLSLKHPWDLN